MKNMVCFYTRVYFLWLFMHQTYILSIMFYASKAVCLVRMDVFSSRVFVERRFMDRTQALLSPTIQAIAAQLPEPCWTTEELLEASGDRFSDRLQSMLRRLGVDKRHSVLANYPEVLFAGAEPELAISGSTLAVQSARTCIEKAAIDPGEIGLVLGVTSSPSRLLPSLVCDLFQQMDELRRDTINVSIEYMGCSAIAKAVDVARWFLVSNPDKYVLICFMDAITPLSPPLPGRYAHFSEVPLDKRQETVNAMHGVLFGDASVAMVLGSHGDGPAFGPIVHLTNDKMEDAELGTVPDGGSDIPIVKGERREYTLGPDVTPRGTFYAVHTVKEVLAKQEATLHSADKAVKLLMHTGSERILDGLCEQFGVSPDSPAVASSYRILRDYGNTIGCSVPLMLADPEPWSEGGALMVAFGLSFSCGAGEITVAQDGWRP
jgi:3-oxoacyl-[acyl-carrier-protein] synthase III